MAFECGICALVFNNSSRVPIILECGHSLCKDCLRRKLGPHKHCPYCRNPIRKELEQLPRNFALENAMEAANLPLVELLDRWGFANAERLMVKPDQLQLTSLISRKGNSGEVWKGTLWGKQVAVKLVRIGDLDGRHLECLRREVAVLLHTTGECKQVCIYKGFCMKGAHFAIIMKLYSCSLAARIARHPGRRLPLYLAVKYAVDIAKGLVELHKLGVMVADLKPDNVLLDEELGDAVIADFGISSVVSGTLALKRNGAAAGGQHHASSGGLRGTPHYMAPEQFGPHKQHTIKADLWGFACTLLHMVTGMPPWAHDNMLQICTTVGVRRQAPTLPEGLPGELQQLLAACLSPDPGQRPAAQQVLKVLSLLAPRVDPAALNIRSASAQRHRLLAAARGLLSGLKEDVGHLATELAERAAAGGGGGRQGSLGLHPVPEEGLPCVDDQVLACDQHLQQLQQLLGEASSTSSANAPSAPPLPAGLLPMRPTQLTIPPGQHPGFDSVNSPAGSCSSGGSPDRRGCSSIASSSSAYRPILWTEQQGLEEEMQYQQQQYGRGRSSGHARSNSAAVNYTQQQLTGGFGGAGDARAGHLPASPGRHQRSVSELPPGGSMAAAVLTQRRRWEAVSSHPLPTHQEVENDGCSSLDAAGAAALGGAAGRYLRTTSCSSTSGGQQETSTWNLPGSSEADTDLCRLDSCQTNKQLELVRPCYSPVSQAIGRGSSKLGGGGPGPGAAAGKPGTGGSGYCHAWGVESNQSNQVASPVKTRPEDSAAAWGLHRNESSLKGGPTDGRPFTSSTVNGFPSPNKQHAGTPTSAAAAAAGASTATADAVAAGNWCSRFDLPRTPGSTVSGSPGSTLRPLSLLGPPSPGAGGIRGFLGSPGMRPAAAGAGGGATGAHSEISSSSKVPPDSPSKARRTLGDLLLGRDRSRSCTPVGRGVTSSPVLSSPARGFARGQPSILSTCAPGAAGSSGSMAPGATSAAAAEAAAAVAPGTVAAAASKFGTRMDKLRRLFGMPPLQLDPHLMAAPPSPQRHQPSDIRCVSQRPVTSSTAAGSGGMCRDVSPGRSVYASSAAAEEVSSVAGSRQPLPPSPFKQHAQQQLSDCGSPGHRRMVSAPPAMTPTSAGTASPGAPVAPAMSPLRRHKHQLSLPGGPGGTIDIREPGSPHFSVSPPPGQYHGAESPGMPGSTGGAFAQGAWGDGQPLTKAGVWPAAGRESGDDTGLGHDDTAPGPCAPVLPTAPPSAAAAAAAKSAADLAGRSRQSLLAEAAGCEEAAKQLMTSNQAAAAEARIRRALELLTAALGPCHASVYSAQSRLASCLCKLGAYTEAETLFRRVLQQRGAVLGRGHPQAATAANNLATCLYTQGKYGPAAKLYGSALLARQRALGMEHPDTAACVNNLALCHMRQGDYTAALPLCEQAVQLRAAALGQVHPEVASAAHNLGVCHTQLGQHQAALDAHLQALAVRQQLAAEDQSSSAAAQMVTSCRAVAACLARLGRHEEAAQQLATVLDTARSAVADVLLHGVPPLSQQRIHSVVSSTRGGGGSMPPPEEGGAGGSAADGSELTEEQQQCLLGVAAAAEELGKCYSHQGVHARAEELYWEAMEAAVAVVGSRSDMVARLEGALRECLTRQLNRC